MKVAISSHTMTNFYQDTKYHTTQFNTVNRSYRINLKSLPDYKLFTAATFYAGVGQAF